MWFNECVVGAVLEVKVVLVLLKFASAERTKMAAVCELKQASQLLVSS